MKAEYFNLYSPLSYIYIQQGFQWGIWWNKEGQMGITFSNTWEKIHDELNMLACNEKETL